MFRTGLFTLAAGASLAAAAAFAPGTAEARPSFGVSTPGFSFYVGPRYGYGYGYGYDRPYYSPYGYGPTYSYGYGYSRPYAYDYGSPYRYRRHGQRRWKKEAFSGE